MTAAVDVPGVEAEQVVLNAVRRDVADLQPKRVEFSSETDGLGEEAWRLLLVLPAPTADTWDRDKTFRLRRSAVLEFDRWARAHRLDLPGHTVALVTTDDADLDDVAPVDEPEPGEDPGRPM